MHLQEMEEVADMAAMEEGLVEWEKGRRLPSAVWLSVTPRARLLGKVMSGIFGPRAVQGALSQGKVSVAEHEWHGKAARQPQAPQSR